MTTDNLREAVAPNSEAVVAALNAWYGGAFPFGSAGDEEAMREDMRDALIAALSAIEAAGWRVVNEGVHLPCSVQLPPATTIVAGCRLGTLIDALEHRGMPAPRLDATVRSGEEG